MFGRGEDLIVPLSRPVWGAWIEMCDYRLPGARGVRRAPYGARGLKSIHDQQGDLEEYGRAPYGARGLKFPCI